ncbi:MAG: thiamine pyrophosphate-dependent enzyme [Spirochaetes bacterium]|nr:thiamine pyrophosphate-dependent enzyme [Spirochaetota bacterium]
MSNKIYEFPKSIKKDVIPHYCGGCAHGVVHKLIGQVMDELGIQGDVILAAPVGCAVFAYRYLDIDGLESPHGRAGAVATGLKRAHPDKIVMTYQGDGDLLAIGASETLHAANRGEGIVTFFVNNAIYGMTGGQMAPTTMPGQVSSTTPFGRKVEDAGYPMKGCELLNTLERPYYIERCSTHDVKHILKTKAAIKKAFEYQKENKGYCLVEILGICTTNWGMGAVESTEWLIKEMLPYFPLKVFRDKGVRTDA